MPLPTNSSPPARSPKANHRTPAGFTGAAVVLALLLVALAGLSVAAWKQQSITDWWRLRHYDPPAPVAHIAAEDTMTAGMQRIFYVNHPDIANKSAFAAACPNGNEQTVVLGCYHGDQGGIYVLSVSDPRLQGIEQVTAAHEALHAAYDRLSTRERQQVDGWLQDYFDHGLQDQTVRDQIESYKSSEPDQLQNEMHSILGTEVANLPAPLEQYYRRYFTNRAAIVQFYEQYEAEFTTRQAAIKADDAQLQSLKGEITSDEADLSTKLAALNEERQQLDQERSGGDVNAYNAGVPTYNRLVSAYNQEVASVRSLVSEYNDLVQRRNALALEEQQLVQDITAQPQTVNR